MKAGDMVKFEYPHKFDGTHGKKIGLLIEYHTWEKISTVLYKGEVFRIRAEWVTKAGKKDGLC